MTIKELSWPPLPFNALFHGSLSEQIPARPKSALLMSWVMILISALLPLLRILNSTISWPLQPRLISAFTSSTFLICNYEVQQNTCPHSILYHLGQEICPGTSRVAYVYLCCSFGRYQVGKIPPGEPQPATRGFFCLQKTFSIFSSCLFHLQFTPTTTSPSTQYLHPKALSWLTVGAL